MAFKSFMAGKTETDKKTANETPVPEVLVAPVDPTPPTTTFIDASTHIQGTLRCEETLHIDGHLSGELACEKTVVVREGAQIHADIAADAVQITGEVNGNISARRKITLNRMARVKGDLVTPGIVIEEGAQLEGRIVIGSEKEPSEEPKFNAMPDAKLTLDPDADEVSVSSQA
jgi:cytoskeletal protein CcmA (bactofilin family)